MWLRVWNEHSQYFSFITRVTGEGDELLEDVSGHHPRLLPEHGVQLGLPLVVAEEVPQLLGHDGCLVLARQLAVGGLQDVGLSQTERSLEILLFIHVKIV